jgi:transposase-like protein
VPEIAEDGGMGKETERSAEMRRVLEEYATSGLRRREFCQQHGIALTTFDYWRRVLAVRPRKPARRPRLVAVRVAHAEASADFGLCLANGRRIECSWRFADAELARLIRIAESA